MKRQKAGTVNVHLKKGNKLVINSYFRRPDNWIVADSDQIEYAIPVENINYISMMKKEQISERKEENNN